MRIIVNDSSVLIDLRKAGLLQVALGLPYAFQVALPLVQDELLAFSAIEISELEALGLEIVDLTAAQVARALTLRSSRPTLSAHDCFTISLAESQAGAMILTGDQALRTQSQALNIEVHGVLWVSDQLEHHKTCSVADLLAALIVLQNDPVVFLPSKELATRIKRLQGK